VLNTFLYNISLIKFTDLEIGKNMLKKLIQFGKIFAGKYNDPAKVKKYIKAEVMGSVFFIINVIEAPIIPQKNR
jgi:hypothetical protein